jgi:steroid delta-isomerase-like uncharacterized protein
MSAKVTALVQRFIEEVWNKGNLAVADELVAPHMTNHFSFTPELEGPEDAKRNITILRTAFPDIQYEIEDLLAAERDMVVARLRFRGTHTGPFLDLLPTGKTFETTGIDLFRVADGQIIERWAGHDDFGLMLQLGVVSWPHAGGQPPSATEPTTIEHGFADIRGAQLYYEAAGAGHPLVMLHGHLLDSGQWDDQFVAFAQHYRVVRYDARGFGQSSKPPGSFAHYEDLHAMLGFLGIERAYLMGCSGGGAAIIDFALAYPEQASALILVGAGLGGYQFGEPPPLALELRAAHERGDLERAVELSIQLWTDGQNRSPDQVNPAARERIRTMSARLFAREGPEASPTLLEPPAAGRLAEIGAPMLAIVGDQDVQRIQEIADQVAAQVPGARKVVMPDAGHHPNMEHPALFNQVVLDFLHGLAN